MPTIAKSMMLLRRSSRIWPMQQGKVVNFRKMADYKNNHYVPQSFLNRFKNEDGELFYFDKRKPNKPVIRRSTDKIFCAKDLYVAIDEQGNRNVTLERDYFGELESKSAPIIDRIISSVRVGIAPNLSQNEKGILDNFLMKLWHRTPDSQE